ncbi:MAG TPA: hypothetical protein PKA63_10490 [Oligoflexia bacterium]|nr:hypothetical protein [Oligoflexia bacterium]HMP49085.1 hypothetical protein [Oligoflexia bacterium]
MTFDHILPHIFSTLSLIEIQIDEVQNTDLSKNLLKGEINELSDLLSAKNRLKQTANYLQLSNAKGDTIEAHRLVQIFYGLVWIIRPSLMKFLELKEALNKGTIPVPSRLESVLSEVFERENAH